MPRNRHTLTTEDKVWEWAEDIAEDSSMSTSDVITRAVKVYAGKISSGEWTDPVLKDKYDKRLEKIQEKK
jgi:hypothetical protein